MFMICWQKISGLGPDIFVCGTSYFLMKNFLPMNVAMAEPASMNMLRVDATTPPSLLEAPAPVFVRFYKLKS